MFTSITQIMTIVNFFFLGLAVVAAYYLANRYRHELQRSEILREIAHRYQSFVDNTQEGIFRCNAKDRVIIMNKAGAVLLGFADPQAFFGHEEKDARFIKQLFSSELREMLMTQTRLDKAVVPMHRMDGSRLKLEVTANIIVNDQGAYTGIEGLFHDITDRLNLEQRLDEYRAHLEDMVRMRTAELVAANVNLEAEIETRKQTENELRRSEAINRVLLNAPSEMAVLLDATGVILGANTAAGQVLGCAAEALPERSIFNCLPEILHEKYKQLGRQVLRHKQHFQTEESWQGGVYTVDLYPVLNDRGDVVQAALYAHNITRRRQAELVLNNYHQELEKTVSERTEEISRINSQLQQELNRRMAAEAELKEHTKNLEERVRKATEEVLRMERREFQLEKLATVGEATSTIVHEIRNPLSTIKMGLTTLMGRTQLAPPDERCLEVARGEVIRMEQMLRELLDFGKPVDFHFVEQDINDIVRQTVDALANRLKAYGVEVALQLSAALPAIQIDGPRMAQVMNNLMLNAKQAMPGGGLLSIETGFNEAEQTIEVLIRDQGIGMEPHTVAHIFEPFFSTKKGGTGLGLPLVQKYITAHNGRIDVKSVLNQGTLVCILLPV